MKELIFKDVKLIKNELENYLLQAQNLKYINNGVNIANRRQPKCGKIIAAERSYWAR